MLRRWRCPPDRHRSSEGQCRGVVRRRHVVPQPRDPAVGRRTRRCRPGRGHPHIRARHAQVLPGSGQMVDPPARPVPHPDHDPRSQHGVPSVSTRRSASVHPRTAGGLQLRHHHHHGVSDERLPGRLRADHLRGTGGKIKVPLVEGHPELRPAGHPDDAVLRPTSGDAAGRIAARADLHRQARL